MRLPRFLWSWFNTSITKRNGLGLVIAFLGVLILVTFKEGGGWDSLTDINAYALYVIAACICYSINLHFIKTRFTKLKSIEISSISLLMILPLALLYLFAGTDFSYKMATHSGYGGYGFCLDSVQYHDQKCQPIFR